MGSLVPHQLLAVPWDVKEVSAVKWMKRRLAEVEVRLDPLEDDLRTEAEESAEMEEALGALQRKVQAGFSLTFWISV